MIINNAIRNIYTRYRKWQFLCSWKSAFSNEKETNTGMFFNWTRQSKKLRFPIQLVSRISASEMLESPAANSYEYHTLTQQHDIRHNPTPQHRRRWLGCCYFFCGSARVSVIYPHLCPSAARDSSTRWPQCAVSMRTFRQLTADVGCSFGNCGRNPASW